jgi:hypothetical protein
MTIFLTPNEFDVLFGIDQSTTIHHGNKIFHQKIVNNLENYRTASSKRDKYRLCKVIVDEMVRDYDSQFLQLRKMPALWEEIDAYSKTEMLFFAEDRMYQRRRQIRQQSFIGNRSFRNFLLYFSVVLLELIVLVLLACNFKDQQSLQNSFITLLIANITILSFLIYQGYIPFSNGPVLSLP